MKLKTFGTLEYRTKTDTIYHRKNWEIRKKKRIGIWVVRGFLPTVLLSRIIPDSWSNERGVIEIADSMPNIEHLDMVMYRYPLEIKDKEKWKKRVAEMRDRQKLSEELVSLNVKEPSWLFKGQLLPFQKTGLDFLMKTSGHALLADEMGLGKTVQTLAYIASVRSAMPVVVVSPLVVLRQWESEIKRFVQVKNEFDLAEPTTNIIRIGKQGVLPDCNFYIINYDLLYKRVDDLIRIRPKTVVMDEVQYLRNTDTDKYEGMVELTSCPSVRNILGLSGTPIYNRGSEIWGIADLIEKGVLSTYSEFGKTYCWSDYRGRDHVYEEKQQALAELLRSTIMIRRLKKDVLQDLPEKTRYKQIIDIDASKYEEFLTGMMNEIANARERVNSTTDDTLKKQSVMELNKLYVQAVKSERQIAGISKAPFVAQHIQDLLEGGLDKLVVYIHHKLVRELLHQRLEIFKPVHIRGGQTDNQRASAIHDFQNDKNCRLMIAGLRAGNVGINLTSASYVIHAELDWSPAIHRQAEDRLHRIGQSREVFSYYLIGDGTLDDKIAEKLVDKTLEIVAVMGDEKEADDPVKAEEKFRLIQERIMQTKNR